MSMQANPGLDPDKEIAALTEQLHAVQSRLRELRPDPARRVPAGAESSVLDALPANIALLDRTGVILSVNEGWRAFGGSNGVTDEAAGVGSNYLDVCDLSTGVRCPYAERAANGIRTVLSGETSSFSMEYPCHSSARDGWYRLMVNQTIDQAGIGAVVMHLDITDRKSAEEQLSANAALLRQFIRYAPAAIAMLDNEMRYIQASERWYQDYNLPEEDIVGKCHYDVFPDAPERWKAIHRRALAGSIERCDEDPFPRANGALDWLKWEARPWLQADGKIGGVIFFTQVITEQKRSEDSLALFRNLIDQSNDAVEVLEAETFRFIDANEQACLRLGYTREEFLGLSVYDINAGTDPDLMSRIKRELNEVGFITFESHNQRKDGSTFPVEVSLKRVQVDRPYLVATVRDITDRKRIESRYRRLVNSDIQAVFFWNTAGAITDGNEAFYNLVGYSPEELQAGTINWAAMTPPEFAERDARALEELLATGVCAPYEKEWICRDGSRVSVLVGGALFEDNSGEGVCFVIDLTERKKLDLHVLRMQRMESIGTLAGGIAHDLNNCLSPIIVSLDILSNRFTDPDSQQLLQIIGASARRGADMVRQVLSFARGVEGERKEMQIRHVVHEIENIARDTFPKDIGITSHVPHDLWTVIGDATQLHQVLLNLCVNARDAMLRDGRIRISAQNITIDAHYAGLNPDAKAGPYVLIEVRDNGTGIDPAHLERIFDPFFTTKGVDKGTGIGLSSAAAIVKGHGGFHRVSSKLGEGSLFQIYLPATKGSRCVEPGEARPAMPRGRGELILIVDDEEAARVVTKLSLESYGYRAVVAKEGLDAVSVYTRSPERIDAVLTDMMMPTMDGPTLIQVLYKLAPGLPIIAASGLASPEQLAKLTSLGVQHFLPKPYAASPLLQALEEVLAPTRASEGDRAK